MKYTHLIAAMAMLLSGLPRCRGRRFASLRQGFRGLYQGSRFGPAEPQGTFQPLDPREATLSCLGELPKNFAGKSYFIALTVSSGDRYAGLQSGDWVVEWRRYDDRLALIAPNLDIRATGDAESKASVKRLFTDQVLLGRADRGDGSDRWTGRRFRCTAGWQRQPILWLFGSREQFADHQARFGKGVPRRMSKSRLKLSVAADGCRPFITHSAKCPRPVAGFKPRKADERVGYFTTAFSDLSKYEDDETRVRYINRWHLQKRDSSLQLSPPKEPIRFYVEHTAPVRYRRWIKAGIDYWNKAFEKVGLVDAIVIEYQDAESGAHMEKDPEDVRYNFIRWLNNDVGTAIGPSRVHPMTGQILDADIILTDGWIRHFNFNYADLMPKLAMEGVAPETLAWLGQHPRWDPRVRMAPTGASQLPSQSVCAAVAPADGWIRDGAGRPFAAG